MELKTYEMISYVFKSISNSHITLSFFFGIETTNTLILSRSSLENHTRFHTKRAKSTNWFKDINGAKKTIPFGGHVPIWLRLGSTPPGERAQKKKKASWPYHLMSWLSKTWFYVQIDGWMKSTDSMGFYFRLQKIKILIWDQREAGLLVTQVENVLCCFQGKLIWLISLCLISWKVRSYL